jgi:hypothetical protein
VAQVINKDNLQEFIEKGKVAEFVPPEPPKEEAKAEEAKPPEVKDEPKAEEAKAEPEVKDDAEDDANLPEWAIKRINKKHREMKEAEEWAREQYLARTAAEKRAEELEARLKAQDKPKEPEQEPKPENFATQQEYIAAAVRWGIAQEKAKDEAERAKAEEAERITAAEKRINAAMERIPDYRETIEKADITMRVHLLEYIRDSESGPELAYYIAKHPEEAERLNKLTPIKGLAEMGKLELKATAKAEVKEQPKEAPKVPLSKAPAPITPIEGKDATINKDPSQMNFKEIRELERQQRMKAQRR